VAIDHALAHAVAGAVLDAGPLELERRHDRRVARQKQVERLVVHEGAVLQGVVAGAQGVLDALGGAAVAGDLQAVVVGRGDDGVHLVERHAERVVVVGVGGGGVAGGVGLDPLDAVLDQLAHRGAGLVGAVDQQHQALHADLAEVGVPVHQAADPADFAPAGRQARPRNEVVLDGLFQKERNKCACATSRAG
jgi:hypothetical protein